MAQPAQVFTGAASGTYEWSQIDNSSAPSFPSLSAGTNLGYDTTAPGSVNQGVNKFGDTGSVLLDSVNDTVFADPQVATFAGNPVSKTAPTYKTVTTVLNSPLSTRLLWKNPA